MPLEIHGSELSFYRNIFLSQYRVPKCLVCNDSYLEEFFMSVLDVTIIRFTNKLSLTYLTCTYLSSLPSYQNVFSGICTNLRDNNKKQYEFI